MTSTMLPFDPSNFRQELEAELLEDILPFWIKHVADYEHGGFHGAVTNDLKILDNVPRTSVLGARLLWTFSTAYRVYKTEEYLSQARHYFDYLTRVLWDAEYGGLYFSVDSAGRPKWDGKMFYTQAFGIYGLSEYFRAAKDPRGLEFAKNVFQLIENHGYDPVHQGYVELCTRKWKRHPAIHWEKGMPPHRKSMNTMLHILEAYTNLLRVWEDPVLRARHKALIENFLERIVDPAAGHFRLFFNDKWKSLVDIWSFGHDIEGSWLLWEAAGMHNDPDLHDRVRKAALALAVAVQREALEKDGGLVQEGTSKKLVNTKRIWWAQAEAVVGFYNAYQLSGQVSFAEASYQCWKYIQDHFIDREHGEWFKELRRNGTVYRREYKTGPWSCPYHNSRACFEMISRLER